MLWVAGVGGLVAGPHEEDAPNLNRKHWHLADALLRETDHSPKGADSAAQGAWRWGMGLWGGGGGGIPAVGSPQGALSQGSEVQGFSLWERNHTEWSVSVCCPGLKINPRLPVSLQNKRS